MREANAIIAGCEDNDSSPSAGCLAIQDCLDTGIRGIGFESETGSERIEVASTVSAGRFHFTSQQRDYRKDGSEHPNGGGSPDTGQGEDGVESAGAPVRWAIRNRVVKPRGPGRLLR